jgi:hypothetical protein
MEITDAMLVSAAAASGWRRVGAPFTDDGAGPFVSWVGAAGVVPKALYADVLPEPRRQAERAALIALFTAECPVCGAVVRERGEGPDDAGLAQLVTVGRLALDGTGVELTVEVAARTEYVIVHGVECPASPRSIDAMAAAGSN